MSGMGTLLAGICLILKSTICQAHNTRTKRLLLSTRLQWLTFETCGPLYRGWCKYSFTDISIFLWASWIGCRQTFTSCLLYIASQTATLISSSFYLWCHFLSLHSMHGWRWVQLVIIRLTWKCFCHCYVANIHPHMIQKKNFI